MTTTTPIARGNLRGVQWKSLTSTQQARTTLLEYELKKYNQFRRSIELNEMGHDEYLKHRHKMNLHQWLNKPLCDRERLLLYKIRSKYNNQIPLAWN